MRAVFPIFPCLHGTIHFFRLIPALKIRYTQKSFLLLETISPEITLKTKLNESMHRHKRGTSTMKKQFLIICIFMLSLLSGCVDMYAGKYLNPGFPSYSISNLEFMDINSGSVILDHLIVNFKLTKTDSAKYEISGIVTPRVSASRWKDVNIYMILANDNRIIQSIRLNSIFSRPDALIRISKEFLSSEDFNKITFFYQTSYYTA